MWHFLFMILLKYVHSSLVISYIYYIYCNDIHMTFSVIKFLFILLHFSFCIFFFWLWAKVSVWALTVLMRERFSPDYREDHKVTNVPLQLQLFMIRIQSRLESIIPLHTDTHFFPVSSTISLYFCLPHPAFSTLIGFPNVHIWSWEWILGFLFPSGTSFKRKPSLQNRLNPQISPVMNSVSYAVGYAEHLNFRDSHEFVK